MEEDKSKDRNKLNRMILSLVKRTRLRIGIPGMSYEVELKEIMGSSLTEDERIKRLETIKGELTETISFVDELSIEAKERKNEIYKLRKDIEQLQDEQAAVEKVLSIPREIFIKMINSASSKGKTKGIIIGIIIGLITGIISSYIVWILTK